MLVNSDRFLLLYVVMAKWVSGSWWYTCGHISLQIVIAAAWIWPAFVWSRLTQMITWYFWQSSRKNTNCPDISFCLINDYIFKKEIWNRSILWVACLTYQANHSISALRSCHTIVNKKLLSSLSLYCYRSHHHLYCLYHHWKLLNI